MNELARPYTHHQGLTTFINLRKHVPIEVIIVYALEIAQHNPTGPKGPINSWPHFFWSFNNAWKKLEQKRTGTQQHITSTFPLCAVLTDKQINYIKNFLEIKTPYVAETPLPYQRFGSTNAHLQYENTTT